MGEPSFTSERFDRTNPLAIYNFSRLLMGKSLHDIIGDDIVANIRKGKGGLGQMVEKYFFGYDINSDPEADFKEAKVELKCTPLLKSKTEGYRIKERLVCTMIDYCELANTRFEDSHLLAKCRLMLLLFYLHVSGSPVYDYEFLFRILWELPPKDLLQIKKDYETIAAKVRKGEAHLLSEGDTLYLGACRKGQKGDSPQNQPFSKIKANKRAFSLKPAYMRYVLDHVLQSGENHFSNYTEHEIPEFELVTAKELEERKFEDIILERFSDFYGMNYVEICRKLHITPYQAKNKYADIAGLIASKGTTKRISKSEEFLKSGITLKTIRLRANGMPKEGMSFKNIDYVEVYENDEWTESETYEIFTNRFMFVVFKPIKGKTFTVHNNVLDEDVTEQSYVLDKVFFWTMPAEDVELAKEYWQHIRECVLNNRIRLDAFWSIRDDRKFHVRPKAAQKSELTINPKGGECEKYSYWFNANYVKQIIDSQ